MIFCLPFSFEKSSTGSTTNKRHEPKAFDVIIKQVIKEGEKTHKIYLVRPAAEKRS